MVPFKLFDELCEATTIMADIIRKQQAVIEQHGIEIEDPVLNCQIDRVEELLDDTEMAARKF